ncbi:MAG: ATP-binding cassette domain-containing protein [Acidobacteria bacterium]|nr:ATP-binding cassette domain-containing protein [Acidobacteriota bacterium]
MRGAERSVTDATRSVTDAARGTTNAEPFVVSFRRVSYAVPQVSTPIIAGLDLDVRRGETLVLLGESGCGKTTTLKLINRLLVPTGGEVLVEGRDTREWDAIQLRRRTGYVIQEAGLFPHFTVERNIGLVPSLEGWNEARTRERTHELLRLVGLEPESIAARYPSELSGGQRQRVGVARALAADPPLLLMDEPFGALDALTREQIRVDIEQLWLDSRKTVVFITHSIDEAVLLSDRVVVISARPGAVERVIPVDLSRPRGLDARRSPRFAEISDEITGIFLSRGVLREGRSGLAMPTLPG